MLPGPVFQFELMTTARKGRTHVIRVAYGVFLLVILWQNFSIWTSEAGGLFTSRQMRWFAQTTFYSFAVFQEIVALALAPALVAGVIADERQRKTLHYLMASRLSSAEIVLGKLGVRLLHAGVCLAVGLPVMSMLTLMGGVDPRLVLLAFAAATSTVFFLGALAILISTHARRVRDAVFAVYALELLWLVVPPIIERLSGSGSWPANLPGDLARHANEWIAATSPVSLASISTLMTAGPSAILDDLLWMIGLQSGLGLLMVGLAVVRLRPAYRAQEAGPRFSLARLRRWRVRFTKLPPCGDDPMHWKELHTSRSGGIARLVGLLATVVLGGLLIYGTYGTARPAIEEALLGHPVGGPWGWGTPTTMYRWQFNAYLSIVTPLIFVVYILGVASGAAGSVTSEHEGDTWVSLTTTLLSGPEILRAKMLGSVWRCRMLALAIVLLWLIGLCVGSIHPIGVVVALVELAVFSWFAAALGAILSLQFRSTHRAQALTLAALLFFNIVGQSAFGLIRYLAPFVWPGCMPAQIYWALVTPWDVQSFSLRMLPRSLSPWDVDNGPGWRAVVGVLTVLGYAGGAFLLTRGAFASFDTAAGRARLPGKPHPLASPAPRPAQTFAEPKVAAAG
jgi:ABC-type transport system involved in multi-copper enzyme maturation permease subunit